MHKSEIGTKCVEIYTKFAKFYISFAYPQIKSIISILFTFIPRFLCAISRFLFFIFTIQKICDRIKSRKRKKRRPLQTVTAQLQSKFVGLLPKHKTIITEHAQQVKRTEQNFSFYFVFCVNSTNRTGITVINIYCNQGSRSTYFVRLSFSVYQYAGGQNNGSNHNNSRPRPRITARIYARVAQSSQGAHPRILQAVAAEEPRALQGISAPLLGKAGGQGFTDPRKLYQRGAGRQ